MRLSRISGCIVVAVATLMGCGSSWICDTRFFYTSCYINDSKEDAAITEAVITMSESMGIKVLAEGVETPEQLEFLRHKDCDEIQGYLISEPQPAHEIEESMDSIDCLMGELFVSNDNRYLQTGT